ncbi:MAG: class I SAM-dependent methyltransferase [Chloroflexi bacterium SZAS-1]|jgi:ubiquinone/menaquinone biosynthesis C-methylase UbiE|nr:class I SAM-dependent methyltransferase [Chloroflexi bacterium SZAS-1]
MANYRKRAILSFCQSSTIIRAVTDGKGESMLLKYLRTQIENRVKNWLLRLTSSPLLGYLPPFVPYESGRNTYMIPVAAHPEGRRVSHDFPVPPKELWLGYGTTAQVYLEAGRHHVNRMLQITEGSGWSLPADARVMDFGCGAGRMARWLVEKVPDGEIWGTDISAPHITWCQQNLTPPIHFVTTTTMPHLPFEDNSFDFIYAGSVFSHLDDLADAWLLELRRIARPSSRIFITIMDQTSISLFSQDKWKNFWLSWYVLAHREYRTYLSAQFSKFTIGRALQAQVFYNRDELARKLTRWFTVHSVVPEAYAFQTALVLEKNRDE